MITNVVRAFILSSNEQSLHDFLAAYHAHVLRDAPLPCVAPAAAPGQCSRAIGIDCMQELEGFVTNIPKGGILAGAETAAGANQRTAGQQSVLGWKSGTAPGAAHYWRTVLQFCHYRVYK